MKKIHKIWEYIKSDYFRYRNKKPTVVDIVKELLLNHCFKYSFFFRLTQSQFLYLPAKLLHRHYSLKYGIQIPCNTKIGYGFFIGHGIGIVIHPTAVIGDNCNISQFTTIGSNNDKAAIIGDNVYIGPSVCIVENVKIGNNVTIGAGAVVVKDIPENATAAGVPAVIISNKDPGRFIINRWCG